MIAEADVITGAMEISVFDQLRVLLTSRLYRVAVPFVAVIVAYGITTFSLISAPAGAWISFISIVGIVLMAATVLVFGALLKALNATRSLSPEQRAMTYQFDDNGYVVRDGAGMALTVPWTTVQSVREDRRAFLIHTRPSGRRYLPKRAFSPEALVALRELMARKLGAGAKLRGA
jgi:hypothetical protein